MKVQFTEKNGKPEWAVLPFAEYERLVEQLETGKGIGATEILRKLAAALDLTLADLSG